MCDLTCVRCRLPGLESSANNKGVEDVFYDRMMLQALRIVLAPLTHPLPGDALPPAPSDPGDWEYIPPPASHEPVLDPAACYTNLLRWRAFTRSQRRGLVLE